MASEPESSFRDWLRRLRLEAGLSQEQLARQAGLTTAAVGALERGERRHPYPHTVRALAEALGLSAEKREAFIASVQRRRPSHYGTVESRAAAGGSKLPTPLTPLVGRENEVALVVDLFERGDARAVTLTGPGGVGKTRLAVEVAELLRPSFNGGVFWVDLSAVFQPGLVPSTIARSCGLRGVTEQEVMDALASRSDHERILLVLDNFEHLIAAAPWLSDVLGHCPGVFALITSREPLRLRGEHEVQVGPLELADPVTAATAEALAASASADLLLQRVRAVVPTFQLTDADASSIAAICARLDGLPLALELAAVQFRYMSPPALLRRLEHGFDMLEGGARDLPPRQRSLRAAVAWSYDLLDEGEQSLFRRLSVFGGGVSAEAVHAVCGADDWSPDDTFRVLAKLIDKSMVRSRRDADDETRFLMLGTIREYAKEQLQTTAEEPAIADRHAAYFCGLAIAAEPYLQGAHREAWFRHLDAELADVRIALSRAADGDVCMAMGATGALAWYWILRGYVNEGSHWTGILLGRDDAPCPPAVRAGVLYAAAAMAWKHDEHDLARAHAEEAAALFRSSGEKRKLGLALALSGLIATSQRDTGTARRAHDESLSLFRSLGDRWGIAYALANLGDTYLEDGAVEDADRLYAESLEMFRSIDDPWGCAIVLQTLGAVSLKQDDSAAARRHYSESIAICRSINNTENVARGLIGLAVAALREGEVDEADALLIESIGIWRALGSRTGTGICKAGLASAQASRGRFVEAARLFGQADAESAGGRGPYAIDPALFDPYRRDTSAALGECGFEEAYAEGRREARSLLPETSR